MNAEQTRAFADELMHRVWEPLDSAPVPDFYHRDVAATAAAYFYRLTDGKIAEFWLMANVDFDYTRNFRNEP